jgi:hypothetical protein
VVSPRNCHPPLRARETRSYKLHFSSGSKATLITRIQEHENRTTLAAISSEPPSPVVQQVRRAHVLNPPTTTPASAAPASDATAPGVPPENTPKYDKQYLDVKIPDLSIPEAEPLVQIVCHASTAG